jgi:hypothetical protein
MGRVHFICRGTIPPHIDGIIDYVRTNHTRRVVLEISGSKFFPGMIFIEFQACDGDAAFVMTDRVRV